MGFFRKSKATKKRIFSNQQPNDRVLFGDFEAGIWFGGRGRETRFSLSRIVEKRDGKRQLYRSFTASDLRGLAGLLRETARWFSFERDLSDRVREELKSLVHALEAADEAISEIHPNSNA